MRYVFATLLGVLALTSTSTAMAQGHGDVEASAPRLLGVLPNYTTVDGNQDAPEISARWMFDTTAKNTFDPAIFAFTSITAALGQGGAHSYPARYATAFADNAIGNFMTSAAMPSLLHQDPRYYHRGEGRVGARALYAVSRIGVTRSLTGAVQLNASELIGNFAAASMANMYYPSGRTVSATLSRWGSQLLWDALANELKEFWPDIHQRLTHH